MSTEIKKSYVVYAYVDYRKEIGTRVIRTYLDPDKAIAFAESLTTKYVDPAKQEGEIEEETFDEDRGPEYVCLVGNVFDARLRFPKNQLTEYGLTKDDVENLWCTRIAVDEAEHFD
jgi:hypothetical protein